MRKLLFVLATLSIVAAAAAFAVCYSLHHVVPQPASLLTTKHDRDFYGSYEATEAKGIPYWIWLVLPRVFPEYLDGTGGYAALGIPWEEGHEMPVGFAKQRIGYLRVTGNCALCHPPGKQTASVAPLLAFYSKCAADPRFSADEILAEVKNATPLSLWDRMLYRWILIPRTREAMRHADAALLFGPTIQEHIRDPKHRAPPKWPQ